MLGVDPEPISILSTRAEGPLASARAEAASLLQLLRDVQQRKGRQALVFVDCLLVLDILHKWGHSDFTPGPKEVVCTLMLSARSYMSYASGWGMQR